ncbi:thioredoxin family protein [Haloferula sp. BvORR071]|uniref:thioredoxin family protein n=1 Tax=Haloferula sp. BvORR071 TaxID=1396141 RepID=UPI002240EF88|nr:thioredoxin family protein [Haloferula sp. BvORR071]
MKTKYLFAAAVAASLGLGSAFAGGEGWSHDFEASKKQAASEKKDLLMDFTGSDWCGWCIKLNDEVFSKDPFKAGTKDKFVLVEVDFPNDDSKLSEETKKQNEELKNKFAIEGFPTIMLCDAGGKPYAQTGYQEGGPEKYVAHLDELRAKREARDKAFAEADKQEGPAKSKALIAALDAMELEGAMVATFYGDTVEKIKAADPKDETGYVKKMEEGKKFADFDAKLKGFFEKGQEAESEEDMKKAMESAMGDAIKFVEKTLADGSFTGENKQKVLLAKASIHANSGKFDDALKAIDESLAAAPNSDLAARIPGFKKQLEAAKNGGGAEGGEEEEAEDPAEKKAGE